MTVPLGADVEQAPLQEKQFDDHGYYKADVYEDGRRRHWEVLALRGSLQFLVYEHGCEDPTGDGATQKQQLQGEYHQGYETDTAIDV
jgi:hypothetical protein